MKSNESPADGAAEPGPFPPAGEASAHEAPTQTMARLSRRSSNPTSVPQDLPAPPAARPAPADTADALIDPPVRPAPEAADTTIGMFALTVPDQQAAMAVAQTIAATQIDGGLKADDNRALQGMTVMGSVPGSQPTADRAVYVLYNRTISSRCSGPIAPRCWPPSTS